MQIYTKKLKENKNPDKSDPPGKSDPPDKSDPPEKVRPDKSDLPAVGFQPTVMKKSDFPTSATDINLTFY